MKLSNILLWVLHGDYDIHKILEGTRPVTSLGHQKGEEFSERGKFFKL